MKIMMKKKCIPQASIKKNKAFSHFHCPLSQDPGSPQTQEKRKHKQTLACAVFWGWFPELVPLY
jgi:hypothetical protein